MKRIELWAGAECSVVRVGDEYRDQLAATGHGSRIDDLDVLAALGVKAIRFPVLWERTAPHGLDRCDWAWADAWLERARTLGMSPIVGLVHHGSGPRHTSLLDEGFVDGLAAFAGAVARRYPWVEDFTPVNEPLTTARFSGLYGHWYPHARSTAAFARALLTEVRATEASMRAIRAVIPGARLVQTEDIATVFSTPALAYQASYENRRRWLSLDLLCGRVGPQHPLYGHLLQLGIAEHELLALCGAPCPPDVIGVNYYATSDRFLDERIERYPRHTHGGNGRQAYADVEAVRVRAEGGVGHEALLSAVWARYGLPLAITEVHLGCSREEQVRWLAEAWQGAERARAAGVDVRALTVWAAFGTIDWDSLLVLERGHYEPGLFDARAPKGPRATAVARVAADLVATGTSDHPVLDEPGWWRHDRRLLYPAIGTMRPIERRQPRPIAVVGASGRLGRAFVRACEQRGLAVKAITRGAIDVTEPAVVSAVLREIGPWAVINAARDTRLEHAELDAGRCERAHARGPEVLAATCAQMGTRFVSFSSDLVFDGMQRRPYVESDPPAPRGAYGRAKAEGERRVLAAHPGALVVRTGPLFRPEGDDALGRALDELRAGRTVRFASDVTVSPTYVPDLVETTLDLLVDGEDGLVHLANPGAVTWEAFVRAAATAAHAPEGPVVGCAYRELGSRIPCPAYSALASERVSLMPPLEGAISRYGEATAPRGEALGRTGT